MYADRRRSSPLDPRSLGIAVALNAAALAALLLAKPDLITPSPPKPPLPTYNVPIDPPPPALPEPAVHHPLQRDIPVPTPRIDPLPKTQPDVEITLPRTGPIDTGLIVGPIATATPTPEPITIGPDIDPAHRADLQPTYPAGELRAEHEGVVTVRVLIGVDGRVHGVEQVAATSAAFFAATRERALARWRFRPATRGGVPIEAWRTMTIRFVIPR